MANCTAIKRGGERCKGIAIEDSGFCYMHSPDHAADRRRSGSRGGKRAGRGRPSTELKRLQHRFEELAQKVLDGEINRGDGAVAGQLLGSARSCIRDGLAAREQEELIER
jgi:hypothetical protein